jgi:hypothetical protein
MFRKLAVLIVAVGAVATAQAHPGQGGPSQFGNGGPAQFDKGGPPQSWFQPAPTAAPEIDPASAMSAFTLLAGGLVMLRGRRASK